MCSFILSRKECKAAINLKPSAYDILACLESYLPGSHSDFCDSFGYDIDSIKGRDVYLAVIDQYSNLARLFTTEHLEQLGEIV